MELQAWTELTERERGEQSGRQQVYNALISAYLDAGEAAAGRPRTAAEAIVWAAMVTWGLDEEAATQRASEDIEERRCARAD